MSLCRHCRAREGAADRVIHKPEDLPGGMDVFPAGNPGKALQDEEAGAILGVDNGFGDFLCSRAC